MTDTFWTELHDNAPPLTLTPTQEEYNAWLSYYMANARSAEHDTPLYTVDVNDAILNFLTLRTLVERHPEFRAKAEQIVERVVHNAMSDTGGMGMGAAFIARELGADVDEAQRIIFHDLFADNHA